MVKELVTMLIVNRGLVENKINLSLYVNTDK